LQVIRINHLSIFFVKSVTEEVADFLLTPLRLSKIGNFKQLFTLLAEILQYHSATILKAFLITASQKIDLKMQLK